MKTPNRAATILIAFAIAHIAILASSRPAAAQGDSASTSPGKYRVSVDAILADVTHSGQTRHIYKNVESTSDIHGCYEPAFLAFYDPSRSSPGRMAIRVVLTDSNYEAAVSSSLEIPSQKRLIRLPIVSAWLALAPNSPTEAPYDSVKPKILPSDGENEFSVFFDVPDRTLPEIQQRASTSSLRVKYSLMTERASITSCTARLEVTNDAVFSNAINGPVTFGQEGDFSVAVTRNQIAEALDRSFAQLVLTCKTAQGSEETMTLAANAAKELLPLLLSQLAVSNIPYQEAVKQLANFSFDGQDAGTQLNSFLKELHDKIETAADDKLHIDGSAEAKVLDIFSGKTSGSYETQSLTKSLNQHDFKFNWEGKKIVPASLNVAILRRGKGHSFGNVAVEYVSVTGSAEEVRHLNIPIADGLEREYWAPLPIGAVVPFFLSPDEIARLAPQWLPAAGQVVPEPSPIAGTKLPDLRDRYVKGAVGGANVLPQAGNEGGGGPYSFKSSKAEITDYEEHYRAEGGPPKYVHDTNASENKLSDHTHSIELAHVEPRYRYLVYMVRVQ